MAIFDKSGTQKLPIKVEEPTESTGSLSVEMVFDDQTAEKGPLPKKGNFAGTSRSSKLAFEGSISFDWQNPQRKSEEVPKGTVSLNGRLAMPNKPVFSVSLNMTPSNPPNFEVSIDISRGDHFLRGKLTGEWKIIEPGHLKVTKWSIKLKNEDNLEVQIGTNSANKIVGEIFAPDGSTKLADIGEDPDLGIVLVRYIDGTLEALFPTNTFFSPNPVLGTIRGRVIDAQTKNGVPGAWIWSVYEGTSTDSQGFFELKAFAGKQKIEVWHWQYEPKNVEVNVPPHGIVDVGIIELQPSSQPE